jgi:phosphoribosyl 1,2-cyclic phosphodiesterase
MRVRIWGCRGSYPVSGADFVRYGGNTSCIEVWAGDTLIILDAGTGIRPLGLSLCPPGQPATTNRIHVFITHTHWDHITGLPFFQPLFDPYTHLTVYGLRRSERRLEKTLTNSLGKPLFAVPLTSMPAKIDFREVDVYDTFAVAPDVRVTTARLNHPYRAIGYRIESPSGCLTFITDTAPFDVILFGDEQVSWSSKNRTLDAEGRRTLARMRQGVLDLVANADWVIYDTQFKPQEYAKRPHWGHSTPDHAIELAVEAGARHLILFHHDPHRTDEQVDAIEAVYRARAIERGLMLSAAREGLTLIRELEKK